MVCNLTCDKVLSLKELHTHTGIHIYTYTHVRTHTHTGLYSHTCARSREHTHTRMCMFETDRDSVGLV